MVILNAIAGSDRMGKELRCGDICSFQLRMDSKNKQDVKYLKGLIVYDPSAYAYSFLTQDETVPELLMNAAEKGSIEYEVSIKGDGFVYRDGNGSLREATYCSDEESAKWHSLYRNNWE